MKAIAFWDAFALLVASRQCLAFHLYPPGNEAVTSRLLLSAHRSPVRPGPQAVRLQSALSDDAVPLADDESKVQKGLLVPNGGVGDGETFQPMESSLTEMVSEEDVADLRFRSTISSLFQASLVGTTTGFAVSVFKLSIEAVREVFFAREILVLHPELLAIIPSIGGLLVGALLLFGNFKPGLRGTVIEVDEDSEKPVRGLKERLNSQVNSLRKTAASIVTLGTGNSLGPEVRCWCGGLIAYPEAVVSRFFYVQLFL